LPEGVCLPLLLLLWLVLGCRVRSCLHLVLCFSPVGEAFRQRLRMFPSLVNCTTIDWFSEWPVEALTSVARSFCADLDLGQRSSSGTEGSMIDGVLAACVHIQESVEAKSKQYYQELRRYVWQSSSRWKHEDT
jgi:dynein heavy chain